MLYTWNWYNMYINYNSIKKRKKCLCESFGYQVEGCKTEVEPVMEEGWQVTSLLRWPMLHNWGIPVPHECSSSCTHMQPYHYPLLTKGPAQEKPWLGVSPVTGTATSGLTVTHEAVPGADSSPPLPRTRLFCQNRAQPSDAAGSRAERKEATVCCSLASRPAHWGAACRPHHSQGTSFQLYSTLILEVVLPGQ